jgi:hypothetical protein
MADGTVVHRHVLTEDGMSRVTFPNKLAFDKWVYKRLQQRQKNIYERLTPFQFHVTQRIGSERPFTGAYWDTREVGMYNCVVCTQRLFLWDHKY